MGLFIKKPKEKNEIENKVLKENIANTALAQLSQGEDYESLAYTKVEFGYLFDIENHGIERFLISFRIQMCLLNLELGLWHENIIKNL